MLESLRSSLLSALGVRHGFSLRAGGVSSGPYAALNLGRNLGDQPQSVAENERRFAQHVGYEALYWVQQVHGAQVEEARASIDPEAFRAREADALISRDCAIGVRTADCVAVLLFDRERGVAAAAHAGWRGVVAHTVHATIDALGARYGSTPRSLVAAVFPSIGPQAFEVSEEVALQIADATHPSVVIPHTPRPHVDLGRAVCLQLLAAGLAPPSIERVAGCTFSDSARFFSHRRDAGVTGRHLAVIQPRC